ncbi:MAG: hypothetical protein NWE91_00445 [Candidatus Bathyarchaeota archaeon]|nr:hypothetical protein [Candidatus Bathyarchaeota archaeon]
MSYDLIRETRDTLDELMRMHRLNLELFETLTVILQRVFQYTKENNITLDEATQSLLNRIPTIYKEIVSPPFLQHQTIRRKKTRFKSDAEDTVPSRRNWCVVEACVAN